jgi:hypothetical protein
MKTLSTAPLRYSPDYEVPEPGEAETAEKLRATLQGIADTTFKDEGRPLRSVHAKAHGIVHGRLEVLPDLPPHLAQGLFARPDAFPVVLRFSTTPGDLLNDSVSTPRGVAMKVVGVEGERVAGSEDDRTQDFVLVNGPAFHAKTGSAFLRSLKLLAATTDTPQIWKIIASAVFRRIEALIEALGGKSATLTGLGGHPATHILGETFFSQVPILYGPYMAKVSLAPVSQSLKALTGTALDLDKPNAIRDAVQSWFVEQDGEWHLKIQLCTDITAMPVEEPTKVWSEDLSPYVAVAVLRIPAQDSWNDSRAREDAALAFSPWRALKAHRPLGRIMRLRKDAYSKTSRIRRERAGCPLNEPE